MTVKYRVIQRGQPGVVGGGEKKYYAIPVSSGKLSTTDMIKSIEKISTVSGADVQGSVYGMVDVSIDGLLAGRKVELGDLGSFRIGFSSEGKENEEDVTASDIKRVKIIFTPGPRLKEALKNVKFEKE
ncbi:HU family DNA-binding protein [Thermophagus sp. OGC60D27]|uniref:HU family DNA-binding protein n=1 Tax=Thermophagus sp. OGC60D27 TaxID=3458415 RepID=UPI00403807EF